MRTGLPMTKSSLSNSLNSSGGTFNSNSSLNSTPTADRYAALKDLDEQLRDAKSPNGDVVPTEPAGNFRIKRGFVRCNKSQHFFTSPQQLPWTLSKIHSSQRHRAFRSNSNLIKTGSFLNLSLRSMASGLHSTQTASRMDSITTTIWPTASYLSRLHSVQREGLEILLR